VIYLCSPLNDHLCNAVNQAQKMTRVALDLYDLKQILAFAGHLAIIHHSAKDFSTNDFRQCSSQLAGIDSS
jgi:hypothetical protein